MLKFIVQFLFFFFLWQSNRKAKGHWFTSSSVLLGIYLLCSFLGVVSLVIGDYTQPYDSKYWLPMLEFDFFLLLFLLPFRTFREAGIKKIILPNKKLLDAFSIVIIALSFYSILFFIGSIRNIFSMANLADARNSMVAGENLYFEAGIMATIASVSAANYVFAIVLFFVYQIIGGSKWRQVLLLVSSISEPVHILSFVGRDGIVFWIFTFVFCFAFFRPYLPSFKIKKLLRTFLAVSVILLIPFLLISLSRFGDSDRGTGGSFVSYLGQSFIQGPLFFGLDKKPLTHGAAFPLFRKILGMPVLDTATPIVINGDWVSYMFSTFVVSMYQNLELWGLLLLIVFVFIIVAISFGRAKRKLAFSQFIMYLLYFQIVSQGVFYFKHYTRGGNLFILSCMALAVLFSLLQQYGKPVVLRKRRVLVKKRRIRYKKRVLVKPLASESV